MDPILDTGFLNVPATCTGQVERLRPCHIMEAKMMKYHVLPRELANFGGKLWLSSK